MTHISIIKTDDEYMISVSGHANHKRSVNDSDIVCAALSCLTETLRETLSQLEQKGICKIPYVEEESEACRIYRVKVTSDNISDDLLVNQTVKTIANGFEMLAASYPKNIFLNISM